jgi:2-hydroxy-3-keto-5-methylthiopentenyl-1-phosphate phosphatase
VNISEIESSKVLISDFDGTMTKHDFYKLAIESLLPPDTPDFWADYRSGSITHFEALRRYFAEIRGSEEEVLRVVHRMQLDPGLAESVEALRMAGWMVVVTSAGCEWYIRQLLDQAGVSVKVHANPGRFEPEHGLQMEMPIASAFFSPTLGVNKCGVVQSYLDEGRTVAFAGDGYPDAEPARLVHSDLRFARGDLAQSLAQDRQKFYRFENWSDIAKVLVSGVL